MSLVKQGAIIGRLTVLKRSGSAANGDALWLCLCTCKEKKKIRAASLRRGTVSCGCFRNDRWKFYGAKGINVCIRWRKFAAFLADMGDRPKGTVLGRIGDVGDYKPKNCKWMSHKEDIDTRKEKRALCHK